MQRDRGRCPGAANTRLAREIIACVAMLEDPGDERRVGDRGDDTNCSATARTMAQVDREHPAQALHPAHRGRGRRFHGIARGTVPGKHCGIHSFGISRVTERYTVNARCLDDYDAIVALATTEKFDGKNHPSDRAP